MSDHAAFLAAVLAHPDEDGPRLAYADHLDERGDPCGEFVRVQCRLENPARDDPAWDCTCRGWLVPRAECVRCQLRRRERELLLKHGGDWLPNVDVKAPATGQRFVMHDGGESEGVNFTLITGAADDMDCEFSGGFVEAVALTAADWLAHADALIASTPLRQVRLTTEMRFRRESAPDDGSAYFVSLVAGDMSRRCRSCVVRPSRLSIGDAAAALLAAEWPGVEFELPPSRLINAQWDADADVAASLVDLRRIQEQMRDQITASFGVPTDVLRGE